MNAKRRTNVIPSALLIMLAASVHAADGTWNSTASANWNVATNPPWAGGVTADGSGFTANFNTLDPTADVTVTLGANRTIGNLVFGDTAMATAAGWTVTGSTLTLAGTTPTVTVNALGTGKTAVIASTISGTQGLTKDGSGTLSLTAVNSYTGGTVVNLGVLLLSGGSGANGVIKGALTINSGAEVRQNAATWSMGYDAGSYVTSIAVNGGTLNFAVSGGGIGADTVTMTGGEIKAGAGVTVDWYKGANGTKTLTTSASTTTALFSGPLNLRIGNGGTAEFNIASGATGDGVDFRLSGVLSASQANQNVTKKGAGTMELSAANTFTGDTKVEAGTLKLTHDLALQSSTLDTSGAGVVTVTGTTPTFGGLKGGVNLSSVITTGYGGITALTLNGRTNSYSGIITEGAPGMTLTKSGGGVQTLTGGNSYTGLTTINNAGADYTAGNTLILANPAGAAVLGNVKIGNNTNGNNGAVLRMGAANQFSSTSVVSFDGTTAGQPYFELNGFSQTIAGLSSNGARGTVEIVDSGTPGAATLTINVGGANAYTFGANIRRTWSGGASVGALNIVKDGTGTQTFTGNQIFVTGSSAANAYNGGVTVNQGTLVFNVSGSVNNTSVSIASGATLEVNPTVTGVGNNNVSFAGGGTLKKTGSLIWDMAYNSAASKTISFDSGALIDVQGGTLRLGYGFNGNWAANKSDLTLAGGATFDVWDATSVVVDALNGAGSVNKGVAYGSTPGPTTLTIGSDNGGGTFSGSLQQTSGVLNLTKTGSATQILSGSNTYTGATTINDGILQIGDAGTSGTLGSGAVENHAALVFKRSNEVTVNNNISGTGTLTQAGAGTLTLGGANSYGGTTHVNQGTLLLNGTTDAGGRIDVSAGASFGGGGAGGLATFAGAGDFSPGATDMSDNQLDLSGLTLAGNTVLKYELGTPSSVAEYWYDHVNLTGPLTLAGSLRITAIDNGNTMFGTPVAGDRWLLMAYPTGGGMLTNNGLAVDTANSPVLSSGLIYQIDTSTDGAIYLTVAVPEAGTGVLAALGSALLLRRRFNA